MDENRLEGTVRKVAGEVQEGVGRMTGDAKMQSDGMASESVDRPKTCMGRLRRMPQNWSVPWATL
jgi:uncharacterized protein YjbJ (UPF0337 family)